MITPNTLTVLRIVLALILYAVLWKAASLWAYGLCVVLFTTAALTDLWDGQMARKHNMESNFGKIADPIADKILILGSFLILAARNVYSIWWIMPIAVREIAVTVVRLIKLGQNQVLAAEWSGKVKTVLQIITIAVAFFVLVLQTKFHFKLSLQILEFLLSILLITSNVVAIYSGFQFFKRLR